MKARKRIEILYLAGTLQKSRFFDLATREIDSAFKNLLTNKKYNVLLY